MEGIYDENENINNQLKSLIRAEIIQEKPGNKNPNKTQTPKKFSCSKCKYTSNKKQNVQIHINSKMHEHDDDLKVLDLECEDCMKNIDHKHPSKRERKMHSMKQHPKRRGNEKYTKDIKHDYTTGTIQHPIGSGSMFKCSMSNCGFSTNFKKIT